MKAITNEETRNKLLEQLRNAVCIQLALWRTCFQSRPCSMTSVMR